MTLGRESQHVQIGTQVMTECDGILSCDCSMVNGKDSPKRSLRLSDIDKLNQIMVSGNVSWFIFKYIYMVHCECDTWCEIYEYSYIYYLMAYILDNFSIYWIFYNTSSYIVNLLWVALQNCLYNDR